MNFLIGALLLLPIVLPVQWFGSQSHNPVSLVLGVLGVSIGVPFLVLSGGAPLLQKWFVYFSVRTAVLDDSFLARAHAGFFAGGDFSHHVLARE